MPIHVTPKVLGSVYFPGDTIECHIEFTNVHEKDQNGKTETIAWSFAQFYGQYTYDSNAIQFQRDIIPFKIHPSWGIPPLDHGGYLFISPQEVIACKLELKPGESKTFLYTCKVKNWCIPPSFIGKFVKYKYVLSVSVVSSFTGELKHELKIPVKIANPLSGFLKNTGLFEKIDWELESQCTPLGENDYLIYRNKPKADPSLFEKLETDVEPIIEKNSKPGIVDNVLESLTFLHFKVSIQIHKNKEKVVQLTLEKSAYELGDTIQGVLDFQDRVYACYQLTASLEIEEEIEPSVCPPNRKNRKEVKRKSYFHESTHHTRTSYFSLYIPVDKCTQNFESDFVKVTWYLRFEFITSKNPITTDKWDFQSQIQDCEILHWKLPLLVYVSKNHYELIHDPIKPRHSLIL